MPYGYNGKILRIDLTDQSIAVEGSFKKPYTAQYTLEEELLPYILSSTSSNQNLIP